MEYTFASLIIPAFVAGVLMFLAPCTLPLVPGYLGLIGGTSLNELKDTERVARARWKIFFNGVFFIVGFSLVFILLGTIVAFVSASLLAPYRLWLSSIGGIFVILFGITMVNGLRVPFFSREGGFKTPSISSRGKPLSSLAVGAAFGFGWTPCVGPILGSILLLASTSTSAFQGASLLLIFSLGLAVPFLLIAVGIGSASHYISSYFHAVTRYRTLILALFGLILGFLLNPLLIQQGDVASTLRIGTIDTGIGITFLPEAFPTIILPILVALLLGTIGHRYLNEVDAISIVGGLFFVYLGILLLTNNVGLLISYGFELLRFIEYEELLNYL